MRLELRDLGNGAQAAGQPKWFLERGRRTIGRAPDCDWQLPEGQRSVSKLHCTIERDRDGFLLRDQSANGSLVDGIVVHEGEVARLSDRSRLEVGGLAFSVHISGDKDRDIEDPEAGLALSDERLTISSILADIAPGGRTATGILGERTVEEWPIPAISDKDGAASSRNVEIGWNGPPDIQSATKILPDDWFSDTGSDYGSHLEHGAATRISVPVARAAKPLSESLNDNVPAVEPEDFPPLSIGRPTDVSDSLAPLIGRMEEALEDAFGVFELEVPEANAPPGGWDERSDDHIETRLRAVVARQIKLNSVLESLVREAGRLMEPRLIEAHVDAQGRRFAWKRDRAYWQAYRAQFEKDGKALSVRDVFRAAMTQAQNDPGSRRSTPGQEGYADHEE